MDEVQHYLPQRVERYLAALSGLYEQEGERALQEIIVNAQTTVAEGTTYDRWNGGTYGHTLYLILPESLFLTAAKKRDEIQSRICRDLNSLHNYTNEHIAEVFLEMDVSEDRDWRRESGLLITPGRTVAPEAARRVWDDGGYRLFLSHKSEVKKQTAALKNQLSLFGISAFVAHEDIHPTRQWQDEIENALHTMDAFAALMTEDFHDSDWTDQEVGFALARGVPVIAVRIGRVPYGFLGKFQALAAAWDNAAIGIVKLLMTHERMLSAYIRALRSCPSFIDGNTLALALPSIEKATDRQLDELIAAANENMEVRESFGFRGNKRSQHGEGLIPHLHRLGPRQFKRASDGTVVPESTVERRETIDDEIPF